MNKIFLISLLIGSTILIEPFREDSPCVQLQPENPEDCFKYFFNIYIKFQ